MCRDYGDHARAGLTRDHDLTGHGASMGAASTASCKSTAWRAQSAAPSKRGWRSGLTYPCDSMVTLRGQDSARRMKPGRVHGRLGRSPACGFTGRFAEHRRCIRASCDPERSRIRSSALLSLTRTVAGGIAAGQRAGGRSGAAAPRSPRSPASSYRHATNMSSSRCEEN